jgi:hypothetical protein
MVRVMIWIVILLPLGASAQEADPEDWENYIYIDAGFELHSPGPLTEKIDSVETEIGPLAFHRLYYQTPDEATSDNLIYQLTWVQYPESFFPADSSDWIDEFFQQTIEEATRTVRGYLAYSTPIELQGYPGYLWRINYLDDKAIIKTRAFLRKGQYIAVSTVTFQSRSLNSSTDPFLDSFRFLE